MSTRQERKENGSNATASAISRIVASLSSGEDRLGIAKLKYLLLLLAVFIACLNGRIINNAYAEVPTGSNTFWQAPKWEPLKADGDYVIFKVNNTMDKDIPSAWVYSHSFIAVYDRTTQKVIETYSFVDTNGGEWEDPYDKAQNIRGGEAAINKHLEYGKWTAKELGKGSKLVEALRAEVSVRGLSPATFSWLNNCKVEANNLLNGARQRLAHPDMSGGEGGVVINPEPVSIGEGGAETREKVLGSRPTDDDLSWSFEIPEETK